MYDDILLPKVESASCAGAELKELGLDLVGDLRSWSKASLVQKFGERVGSFLHLACRGLVRRSCTSRLLRERKGRVTSVPANDRLIR